MARADATTDIQADVIVGSPSLAKCPFASWYIYTILEQKATMSIFQRFRRRKAQKETAIMLYESIVGRSREAFFYESLQVPDTIDGRFDVLTMHAVLFLRRIKEGGETGEEMGRELSEVLFKDMDHILREMGVGDLSVARKVREMAEAFYGRAKAYDEGINSGDKTVLAEALKRNLYRGEPVQPGLPALAADYVRQTSSHLDGLEPDSLMNGQFDWGPLPSVADLSADEPRNDRADR